MKYTGYGFYIQLHTLCMFAYGEVVGMRPQRHAFILIPKDAPESGSLIREERSGGTVMSKRQQPRKRPKKPKTDKKQRERLGFSLALAPGTSPAGVPILGGGEGSEPLPPTAHFPSSSAQPCRKHCCPSRSPRCHPALRQPLATRLFETFPQNSALLPLLRSALVARKPQEQGAEQQRA